MLIVMKLKSHCPIESVAIYIRHVTYFSEFNWHRVIKKIIQAIYSI